MISRRMPTTLDRRAAGGSPILARIQATRCGVILARILSHHSCRRRALSETGPIGVGHDGPKAADM